MIKWSEEQEMVRQAVRDFVDNEIRPHREELEFGDKPPYELLRKMFATFGMDEMARASFRKRIAREKAIAAGEDVEASSSDSGRDPNAIAFTMIPIIELCRVCPGMVTAMGVSMGLTGAAIMGKGTIEQKERWALDLLTMDKVGSWAITEPDSGSDAFGSMKATTRRDGEEYVLNGSKTFITNGPYADTIVFICKLDEGNPPEERTVLQFVLDAGMEGLEQPKPFRKMGIHSSPTGMLFLTDVRVGKDRLLGGSEEAYAGKGGREASKATFSMERTGVAAMALGIVDRCLELSLAYARDREQFGQAIGSFQLIQLKLANMQVAHMNLQNLVFRHIEMAAAGEDISFAEASTAKLYSAQVATSVALEAVQLHGGNGYMAEYEVEQLARDAKVLQIYAGTDEIQISQIARSLLSQVTDTLIGEGFEELAERLEREADEGFFHTAAQVVVSSEGERVLDLAVGRTHLHEPFRADTLSALYCTAKPIVTVGILRLIDQGELSLDDRLAHVIDGLEAPWIAERTIEEVLGHTAGLHAMNTVMARILPDAYARTG